MSEILPRLVECANKINLVHVVIGGLALPAYNVVRASYDVDFCSAVKNPRGSQKRFCKVIVGYIS